MSNRSYVSFIAAAFLLFAGAALCRAETTMTLNYKAFPTNADLLSVGTFHPVGSVKLTAPENFYGKGVTYTFLFWDVDGKSDVHRNLSFTPPTDSAVVATAWFLAESGGPCPPPDVCSGVTTWAFSLNRDKVIAKTPIASVTPSKAWTGPPSTSVSTTGGPVVIAAKPDITGFGNFKSWIELPSTPVAGADVKVGANGSALAVAFFGFPEPDPCQSLRNQVANFSSFCDTENGKNCGVLFRELQAQLKACEQKNGEAVTP
jgi:hypothetical protein